MEAPTKANEHAVGLDSAAFDNFLEGLPLATYRAGETVLSDGLKTGRLLILKKGAVVVLKDSSSLAQWRNLALSSVNFPLC